MSAISETYNETYNKLENLLQTPGNSDATLVFHFSSLIRFLQIWSHLLKKILNGKLYFLCSAEFYTSHIFGD